MATRGQILWTPQRMSCETGCRWLHSMGFFLLRKVVKEYTWIATRGQTLWTPLRRPDSGVFPSGLQLSVAAGRLLECPAVLGTESTLSA